MLCLLPSCEFCCLAQLAMLSPAAEVAGGGKVWVCLSDPHQQLCAISAVSGVMCPGMVLKSVLHCSCAICMCSGGAVCVLHTLHSCGV